MATVGLSPYNIVRITDNVERAFRKMHSALKSYPGQAPQGVGDAAYNLFLPKEKEEAIENLLPKNSKLHRSTNTIIAVSDAEGNSWATGQYINAPTKEPRTYLYGHSTVTDLPGIAKAEYSDHCISITPATDGSVIENPELREFVSSIAELNAQRKEVNDKVTKAKTDVETILKQYRTLQKAVEKEGAWLMEFVPNDLKAIYNRPVEKRERKKREAPEPVTVDKDYLVLAATNARLGMH